MPGQRRALACLLLIGVAFFVQASAQTVYSPQVRVEAAPWVESAAPASRIAAPDATALPAWRPQALLEAVDSAAKPITAVVVYRYEVVVTDQEEHEQPAWREVGTLPLQRDQEGWYVRGRGAFVPLQDDFFNRVAPHDVGQDVWGWHLERDAAARPFAVREDRWYMPGLSAEEIQGGILYMSYLLPFAAYTVSFEDDDGTPLGTYEVFAKGSLSAVPWEISMWLDAQKRPALDGWLPGDGADVDLQAVQGATTLRPRYKTMHEVRFYLSPKVTTPHAVQRVVDGEAIDWTLVPDPAPEDARFDGWAFYDPWIGAAGEVPRDLTIHAPTTLVAMLEPLFFVRFLSEGGEVIAQRRAALGETLDPADIAAPPVSGLTFSHWVDESGYVFTAERQVVYNMTLRPVYLATVTFMDGERVHATCTVPVGEVLYAMPDVPERADHWFDGWDRDMTLPVMESITVSAIFVAFPAEPTQGPDGSGTDAGDWQGGAGEAEPPPVLDEWTGETETAPETPIDLYDAEPEEDPLAILTDGALEAGAAGERGDPGALLGGRYRLSAEDVPMPGAIGGTLADCIE